MTTTEFRAPPHADELETLDERALDSDSTGRTSSAVHRRGWLIRRGLAVADAVGLTAAFLLSLWLVGGDPSTPVRDRVDQQLEAAVFLLTLPGWIVVAKLYGLYDRDEERTDHSTADDFGGVFHMITVGAWTLFALAWLTGLADPQLDKILVFWALAVVLVCTSRVAARAYCRRRPEYLQNAIIVGAGGVGRLIAKKYLNHPEYAINLVGFVDTASAEPRENLQHLTLLGSPAQLPSLIPDLDVERVVIAFPRDEHDDRDETLDLIRRLKDFDVQVDVVPRAYEAVGPGVGFHTVEGLPLMGLPPPRLSRSSHLLKRTMDLALTIPGLILISPLLLGIAIAIKLEDRRGPIFFRQVRMGAAGTFRIWKFRTMWVDADERKHEFAHLNKHLAPGGDARMFKIEDDPRVTRVGRVLRRYSLDELPQLFNVVSGEMTLVGPRPLILEENSHVEEWARDRLSLKPGITGTWQALGRSEIPFDEMVKLDYLYVTNWSLQHDMSLLLRTVPTVARTRKD